MSHAWSPVRAVRAALFAAVCVTLAGSGHALASPHSISPWVLLAAFPPVAVAAWGAGGRSRGTVAIGTGLLIAQLLLHVLLDLAHPVPAPGAHPAAGTGAAGSPSAGLSGDGLSMTAAHLLAALGCAWWLARGERALLRLAYAARAAVFRLLRTPLPCPLPAAPPRALRTRRCRGAVRSRTLCHTVTGRGPPRRVRPPRTRASHGAPGSGLPLSMPGSVHP